MVGAFRFRLFLPPALIALFVIESLSLFVLAAVADAGGLRVHGHYQAGPGQSEPSHHDRPSGRSPGDHAEQHDPGDR